MTLVRRSHERGITTLTLDSPANRNALSIALVAELADALKQSGKDGDVRAVVLTHTGNTFCAGADLRYTPQPTAIVRLLRQIIELRKPVVARITGHVRAGGLGLLGASDIAVAGAEATFAFTEVRIGVAPAVISLPLLHRTDPRALSRYYLTGEDFGSAEAARIGLLTAAYSDVDEVLEPILDGLRRASPKACGRRSGCSRLRCWNPSTRTAGELAGLSARLFASADAREGITSLLERRDPEWVL